MITFSQLLVDIMIHNGIMIFHNIVLIIVLVRNTTDIPISYWPGFQNNGGKKYTGMLFIAAASLYFL